MTTTSAALPLPATQKLDMGAGRLPKSLPPINPPNRQSLLPN